MNPPVRKQIIINDSRMVADIWLMAITFYITEVSHRRGYSIPHPGS